ncbi:MAG TPA: hypothetical protein VF715_17395 [Thermoleophilaceae bacterium]|jgi:hypothetical protein
MSSTDTRVLIEQAIQRFGEEVPALKNLKLVIRLELRARGHDAPVWRVEVPGPKVAKDPAGDARVEVSIPRSHFNELVKDGQLKHWVEAYDHGHVNVAGDSSVVKLVGAVIQRQLGRAGSSGLRGGGARPDRA